MDILAFFNGIGVPEIFVLFILSVFAGILPVIAFWKICDKAGFPGPLGLLMIIPLANIILPLYLAFTDWPALRDNSRSFIETS